MSPSWPQPDRAVHQRFVVTEGWREVASTHHDTYELDLPDGHVLRTRISRPPSRKHTYGRRIWARILRDQLHVAEPEFWACVNDGQLPDRGTGGGVPDEAIPIDVARLLVERVGLTPRQVQGLTLEEAIARLNQFWTTGE